MNGQDLIARRRALEAVGFDPGTDVFAVDPDAVEREMAEMFGPGVNDLAPRRRLTQAEAQDEDLAAMIGMRVEDML